jgi:hypothetical protein
MAGKAKSIYLTVCLKGSIESLFHRVFFDAKSYNEYVKTPEFKDKWPTEQYQIIKEVY